MYLVVWDLGWDSIRALRVSPTGRPLDEAPIDVASDGAIPKVAPTEEGFLVAWEAAHDGIYARSVAPDGSMGLTRRLASCDCSIIDVAPVPDGTLVAWTEAPGDQTVEVTRVRADSVLGESVHRFPGSQTASLSPTDSGALLVTTGSQAAGSDVVAYPLGPSGNAAGPPIPIRAPAPAPAVLIDAAWTGTATFVAWLTRDGTDARRYAATVRPAGATQATTMSRADAPFALAWGAGGFVAWEPGRFLAVSGFDVDGRVAHPGGLDGIVAAQVQVATAIGWNGAEHLVAWIDPDRGGRLYAAVLRQRGIAFVADMPILIDATIGDLTQEPAVAGTKDVWIIGWADDRPRRYVSDIYAARMTREGRLLDPHGIAITTSHHAARPHVAAGDDAFLFSWMWKGEAVRFATVSEEGRVGDRRQAPQARRSQDDPSSAWNGRAFLLTWAGTDRPTRDYLLSDVLGMVVGPDGSPFSRVTEFPADRPAFYPVASASPNGWLVVWAERAETDDDHWTFAAASVTPAGAIGPRRAVATVSAFAGSVSVAAGERDAVISWESRAGVRTMRISWDGASTGEPLLIPADTWGVWSAPAQNGVAVVYVRPSLHEPYFARWRAFVRHVAA